MSRVAKMPVAIPSGIDVNLKDDQITVKGGGVELKLAQNALASEGLMITISAAPSQRTVTLQVALKPPSSVVAVIVASPETNP